MDVCSGYYNLEIEEDDQEKTAFSTILDSYEYNRMVQGTKTSAATFQCCMEKNPSPITVSRGHSIYRGRDHLHKVC